MRSLACWGKKRAYRVGGVVAAAYDEHGVVSFPNDPYVFDGTCDKTRFLVVAAGATHACAVTDERERVYESTTNGTEGVPSASEDGGGRMVCWGDASNGKTSPPSFVSSWRAWPTSAESADLGVAFAPSAFAATGATGLCGASTSGVPRATATRALARRTLLSCAMLIFLMFLVA